MPKATDTEHWSPVENICQGGEKQTVTVVKGSEDFDAGCSAGIFLK